MNAKTYRIKFEIIGIAAQIKASRKHIRKLFQAARRIEDKDKQLDLRALAGNLIGSTEGSSWKARHKHLAYGFMRGQTYHRMEQKCRDNPNPDLVAENFFLHPALQTYEIIRRWLKEGDLTPLETEALLKAEAETKKEAA